MIVKREPLAVLDPHSGLLRCRPEMVGDVSQVAMSRCRMSSSSAASIACGEMSRAVGRSAQEPTKASVWKTPPLAQESSPFMARRMSIQAACSRFPRCSSHAAPPSCTLKNPPCCAPGCRLPSREARLRRSAPSPARRVCLQPRRGYDGSEVESRRGRVRVVPQGRRLRVRPESRTDLSILHRCH
jgi:hypothetical protein